MISIAKEEKRTDLELAVRIFDECGNRLEELRRMKKSNVIFNKDKNHYMIAFPIVKVKSFIERKVNISKELGQMIIKYCSLLVSTFE